MFVSSKCFSVSVFIVREKSCKREKHLNFFPDHSHLDLKLKLFSFGIANLLAYTSVLTVYCNG